MSAVSGENSNGSIVLSTHAACTCDDKQGSPAIYTVTRSAASPGVDVMDVMVPVLCVSTQSFLRHEITQPLSADEPEEDTRPRSILDTVFHHPQRTQNMSVPRPEWSGIKSKNLFVTCLERAFSEERNPKLFRVRSRRSAAR